MLPATPNAYAKCPALPAAVTTAVQSTRLGANVTVILPPAENYYCATAAGLVTQGAFPGNKPSDCSAWGGANTDQAGDYVRVTASFAFTPLFPAVSVAALLPTPVVRVAWMRLG
jgi:hypothetical protein